MQKQKVKIVTDSCASLPDDLISALEVKVVPVNIQIGNQTYRDGVDLTRDEFYRRLNGSIPPRTSLPSPGDLEKAYREATADGSAVISIHVTGRASGTYQAARLVASGLPELDIEVFDSLSASMGQGFLVLEAAQAARDGKSKADIVDMLSRIVGRIWAFALVTDVGFLHRSGRIHAGQALLANLLSVLPLIRLKDGLFDVVDRVRTYPAAIRRIIELTAEATRGEIHRLGVVHANVPEKAAAVAELLRERFAGYQDPMICDIGPCIACHGGPGAVGVVVCRG